MPERQPLKLVCLPFHHSRVFDELRESISYLPQLAATILPASPLFHMLEFENGNLGISYERSHASPRKSGQGCDRNEISSRGHSRWFRIRI